MNTAQAIRGITYFALLAWLLYLMARDPKNLPLRAITGLIAAWAIGFPFGLASNTGQGFLVGDPLISELIQFILTAFGEYSLVCFFLFTLYEAPSAARRAWRQLPVPILASIILTISALTTPPGLRAEAARVPMDALKPGFVSNVPDIAVFYFTGNAYMLYACGYALLVTLRYVRLGRDRKLRQGMLLTAIGLFGLVSGVSTFLVANVFLWLGRSADLPHVILIVGTIAVFIGIPFFLIGLGYRSAATRLASIGVWWRHRRAYLALEPLWTALHREFPEDALDRVPAGGLSFGGVHRRYYRRVIECRDGLVRVSPYLAQVQGTGDGESLADQLTAALRAHAADAAVPSRAMPVAMPSAHGLDADVEELVALSQAMRTTREAGT
ncbi:hypothetical protein D5S17_33460 [Pseudonocardiaceae bacterium YIM PH 21723]|nr:hypothetical protein D5S17_33460 [Pseudonocardiaceae bacterium YIM PH 21723]